MGIKYLIILVLSILWKNNSFCQEKYNDERLFSKRIQKGEISGFLVGKYGPPEKFKYFEFLDFLDADVYLITNEGPLKVTCRIEPINKGLNTYYITIVLDKAAIRRIGNQQNLKFDFTFYLKGDETKVVKGGTFRTSSFERKHNNSVPRSKINYDPGFVVTAPAELSIYLIEKEVDYVLRNRKYSPYNDTGQMYRSNYSLFPGIAIDTLSVLPLKLQDTLNDSSFFTLSDLMYIYRFCESHLTPTSFFNIEGNELRRDIESLSLFKVSTVNDSLQALTNLFIKRDALKSYELTKAKLFYTKQKIVAILKETLYTFDNKNIR